MFVWDERKREANLVKHGLDFADTGLVYDHPEKITLASTREGEERNKDLALIEVFGVVLALVYVEREDHVRIISFRRASRKERALFQKRN